MRNYCLGFIFEKVAPRVPQNSGAGRYEKPQQTGEHVRETFCGQRPSGKNSRHLQVMEWPSENRDQIGYIHFTNYFSSIYINYEIVITHGMRIAFDPVVVGLGRSRMKNFRTKEVLNGKVGCTSGNRKQKDVLQLWKQLPRLFQILSSGQRRSGIPAPPD